MGTKRIMLGLANRRWYDRERERERERVRVRSRIEFRVDSAV
jgi:hypothetical protein